mmetsp:Transcript_40510/g.49128  ORF Transcript_40510/g.49128 Transcript_40510/m.49128 type:complete len:233 (-) Transcript_40510:150-848(-)
MAGSDAMKLRILCLHSFRTNAESMKMMMALAGFSQKYADLADFVYAESPHICTPEQEAKIEPMMKKIFPGPYRQWWTASEDGLTYHGWKESITHIKDFMTLHGPFDGVLGFSQGAALAGALPFLQQQGVCGLDTLPPLRFNVIMSGFKARCDEFQSAYEKKLDNFPALIIIGDKDSIVKPESTEKLQEIYNNPPAVVLREPKGSHKVLPLGEDNAKRCRAFLEQQLRQKAAL